MYHMLPGLYGLYIHCQKAKISCHEMLQRDFRVCQAGLMPAQFLCVALSLSLSFFFSFFLFFFIYQVIELCYKRMEILAQVSIRPSESYVNCL